MRRVAVFEMWMHDPKWIGQLAYLNGVWLHHPLCIKLYCDAAVNQ